MLQDNVFSKRLQSKRIEKGLSQNALAKKIGLSRSLYNKYERAGIQPSYETLILLANELNTTVDYLIGNTDVQPLNSQKQETPTLTATEALQILARNNDLSKKDIEYLKETIKLLKMKNKAKMLNDELDKKVRLKHD